ncbi:uncharacterized protein LOC117232835 [Bombus vosnesenskii]|uniref:Uncharacterized protein LOC117232835 n=1 Tax=Bombus vosnesenskii TaxID=207650 RepID=A0A6J3K5P9_9HYME|nr:uncharacterized protein LOC117232835 [Bombus vosnesenskii]
MRPRVLCARKKPRCCLLFLFPTRSFLQQAIGLCEADEILWKNISYASMEHLERADAFLFRTLYFRPATVARSPCYLRQVCMRQREFSRRFRGFKSFNILFSVFFGVRFCSTEYRSNDDTMDKRTTLREEASEKCSINSFSYGAILLRKSSLNKFV